MSRFPLRYLQTRSDRLHELLIETTFDQDRHRIPLVHRNEVLHSLRRSDGRQSERYLPDPELRFLPEELPKCFPTPNQLIILEYCRG